MAERDVTVSRTETWNREVQRLMIRLFRARMLLVPALLVVLAAFYLWDPVPWKLLWVGTTAALVMVLSAVEDWRIRRHQPGLRTVQVNLVVMLLMQSSMIYITGGIESPLLPVVVALGLITGLTLGKARLVLPVTAIPAGASLLFAAGALYNWFPRATPEFLGLGAGFAHATVYVWLKACIIVVLMFVTSGVGILMRRTFERITNEIILARRGTADALASRNREILSVASTVAHELKNPLSSIQGLAQLLARNAAPGSKEAERLEVMRREISRMATVLDEFRNFSRPLSGLSLQRTALDHVVQDVAALQEGSAEQHRVHISTAVVPGVVASCDPHKVKQALLNLVQNSLEATPRDGRVELGLHVVDGREATLTIADSGPGLAPDVRDRLFTPGLTTKDRGSGLGLVVARSIAEQHGGRLTLEDRPAGGCLATLTLPLAGPPAPELP